MNVQGAFPQITKGLVNHASPFVLVGICYVNGDKVLLFDSLSELPVGFNSMIVLFDHSIHLVSRRFALPDISISVQKPAPCRGLSAWPGTWQYRKN